MKKLLGILLAGLTGIGIAVAAELQQFQAGPRLIDGTQLNLLVSEVNNLTGNGTPGAVTGTTGAFSGAVSIGGAITSTGTAASSGITCATYYQVGTQAFVDATFFVATRAFRVVAISQVHSVANGGALTIQVTKDTGTAAPGAGTDLLTAAFDLNATANTVQVGALVATAGVTTLAAGNRLAVDYSTTTTSLQGNSITACMAPL